MASTLRALLKDITTAAVGQPGTLSSLLSEIDATFDQIDTDEAARTTAQSDVDTDVG